MLPGAGLEHTLHDRHDSPHAASPRGCAVGQQVTEQGGDQQGSTGRRSWRDDGRAAACGRAAAGNGRTERRRKELSPRAV